MKSINRKLNALVIVSLLSMVFLVPVAGQAGGCDKWKGEWADLVWQGTKYVNLYNSYKKGKKTKTELVTGTEVLIAKINKLVAKVERTPSCDDPNNKFEKRKNNLLKTASMAIVAMRALEFYEIVNDGD